MQGKKSIVRVCFAHSSKKHNYYNNKFDLKKGDLVFVEGIMAGIPGTVVEVNYNFKIKVSEYNKVVSKADLDVHGEFYNAGSHFLTFSPIAIPKEKVYTWYMPPKGEEEYVTGSDENVISLENPDDFNAPVSIKQRGSEYYINNNVVYVSLEGNVGYAIVEGTKAYELEFLFDGENISSFNCNCPYGLNCKHEYATILQLKEILCCIEKEYSDKYKESNYFAAIYKGAFYRFVIDNQGNRAITI